MTLETTIAAIQPVDPALDAGIQAHLDDLTKPQGSLGRMEALARQYCRVAGMITPVMGGKRIYCMAGDHGVTAEGVSAYPSDVTPQMVMNMLAGGAAINVLARHAGSELVVVDMGVKDPLDGAEGLCRKKVRAGTANMAEGPALSVDEARRAVEIGIDFAAEAKRDGITLLGTGEMGIGNTTPASALLAVHLNCPVREITGRGTGIDDATLKHKIEVIECALKVNEDRLGDPLSALAAVGGLEIAGLCGLILGATAHGIPVIVDGFISSAAACVAMAFAPACRDACIFSHVSEEAGHARFCERCDIEPVLSLGMRLGEGTGAALAMTLVDASVKLYNEMATFSSAGVSEKE